MLTINGVGVKFYGKNNESSDGTYITTKWFVLLMLPIIPLGSYRVRKHQRSSLIQASYDILEKVPLDLGEVVKIYGLGLIFLVTFIFFLALAL